MILTNKCLSDFYEWHFENGTAFDLMNFDYLSRNARNTIVIEFLESVGVWQKALDKIIAIDNNFFGYCGWFMNVEALIIEANKIYNKENI